MIAAYKSLHCEISKFNEGELCILRKILIGSKQTFLHDSNDNQCHYGTIYIFLTKITDAFAIETDQDFLSFIIVIINYISFFSRIFTSCKDDLFVTILACSLTKINLCICDRIWSGVLFSYQGNKGLNILFQKILTFCNVFFLVTHFALPFNDIVG